MLFNSYRFLIFFLIIYSLYCVLNHKWQNRMLLIASYIFYGVWSWKFLSLIFVSTVIDYFCGLKIHEHSDKKKKKQFLLISLICNLTFLGFFKYLNFFLENFESLLRALGITTQLPHLNIILPVGISFYTFQTMSYSIDIYRGQLKPTKKFLDFALFVSFFPQLVAGPIERAKRLLPQILEKRKLSYQQLEQGIFLILWGLFMKVFVADNLAKFVDPVFSSSAPYNGKDVLIAIYAFTFQIYGDFAGYSNIARGLGKLMGFDIMINFNVPFYSKNIQEFWLRWHISLGSWLKDYVYYPIFFSIKRIKGDTKIHITLIITLVLIGFWHGASWNFVIFGFYYGLLLTVQSMISTRYHSLIKPKSKFGKILWDFIRISFTFHLVVIGFMIFRAGSVTQIFQLWSGLFTNFTSGGFLTHVVEAKVELFKILLIVSPVLIYDLYEYWADDVYVITQWHPLVKQTIYFIILILLISGGVTGGTQFIYFQF